MTRRNNRVTHRTCTHIQTTRQRQRKKRRVNSSVFSVAVDWIDWVKGVDTLAPVLPSPRTRTLSTSGSSALRLPVATASATTEHAAHGHRRFTPAHTPHTESLSLSLSPPLRRRDMPSYRGACPSL
ncbi:hypothetical protein CBL_14280 [Carabus blaptoides fortunei]